jgi:PadR family transcriptional regulator PadR
MEGTNYKAQMRKGVLELCTLAVLNNKEAYPSDIISALRDSGIIVVEGTLYPLLTRLKSSGMLSYRWEESTGGPPRKYFCITEDGKKLLDELIKTWEEFSINVNQIIKKS